MMTRRTLVQSAAALGGLSLLPLPTMAATSAAPPATATPKKPTRTSAPSCNGPSTAPFMTTPIFCTTCKAASQK